MAKSQFPLDGLTFSIFYPFCVTIWLMVILMASAEVPFSEKKIKMISMKTFCPIAWWPFYLIHMCFPRFNVLYTVFVTAGDVSPRFWCDTESSWYLLNWQDAYGFITECFIVVCFFIFLWWLTHFPKFTLCDSIFLQTNHFHFSKYIPKPNLIIVSLIWLLP